MDWLELIAMIEGDFPDKNWLVRKSIPGLDFDTNKYFANIYDPIHQGTAQAYGSTPEAALLSSYHIAEGGFNV